MRCAVVGAWFDRVTIAVDLSIGAATDKGTPWQAIIDPIRTRYFPVKRQLVFCAKYRRKMLKQYLEMFDEIRMEWRYLLIEFAVKLIPSGVE
jgi:hypothetical protein